MKRVIVFMILLSTLAAGLALGQDRLSVQVREAELRSSPSYLSGIVTTLAYGDRVTVRESRSGWYRVDAGGNSGWLHESALTEKEIVLQAGDEDVDTGASDTEVALAGRGFNEEVESRYAQEQNLDYSEIDELEASYDYGSEELASFLREGGLDLGGAE